MGTRIVIKLGRTGFDRDHTVLSFSVFIYHFINSVFVGLCVSNTWMLNLWIDLDHPLRFILFFCAAL